MSAQNKEKISGEWFLRAVVEGQQTIDKQTLQQFFLQLGLPYGNGTGFCVTVRYEDRNMALQSVQNLSLLLSACIKASKGLDTPAYSYIDGNLNVTVIICAQQDQRQVLTKSLYTVVEKKALAAVQMGVGRCYPLETVSYSHIEADEALFSIVPGGRISDIDDIYAERSISTQKLENEKQKVIDYFRAGRLEDMMRNLQALAETVRSESPVREGRPYPTSIRRTVLEVLVQIMHICSDAGLDVDQLLNYQDPYKQIFEMRSTPDILTWFDGVTLTLHESMNELSTHKDNHLLAAVKQTILSYLQDPELSLNMVSEQIGITPTYLSAFFAREMGSGFIEHVTGLRIEKAKQLLLGTTKKINDVAQECGFSSASYFIRVFRKYTGLSPAAFRNTRK